jgi:hypothetical protein
MIVTTLARANLGEVSRRNNLNKVLIVQSQNFTRDVLDPRVDKVQPIFPSVNVSDDPIVNVDESVFGLLNTSEHSI